MKKFLTIFIIILILIGIGFGAFYFITNKTATSPIILPEEPNYDEDTETKESFVRVIKVNGKLYYDTGKESTIDARCGNMDGYLKSFVSEEQLPTEDDEANFVGDYGYQFTDNENKIEVKIEDKWIVFQTKENEITTALSLEDRIIGDTIWCGTFQLIWNDLKNDLAKQDIVFLPEQLEVAQNLNKETFKAKDISEKSYYKKIGTPSLELKKEIEKAIKEKFNEESKILDDFDWTNHDPEDYFLYTMLKKEFNFYKEFETLENGRFKDAENVEFFGIKENDTKDYQKQVKVLYYNSNEDFAIKLLTKEGEEVILNKKPDGKTFDEIYNNIKIKSEKYEDNHDIEENEILKIPNLKIDEKNEFTELENKPFKFSNGDSYHIETAIQAIELDLSKSGGKIVSEAGMMVRKESISFVEKIPRSFVLDDTFAIFLVEEGKDVPYFAGLIEDISKFQ